MSAALRECDEIDGKRRQRVGTARQHLCILRTRLPAEVADRSERRIVEVFTGLSPARVAVTPFLLYDLRCDGTAD